jgi:GntR family transcriptional regulator, arabinose operon transcriptional repressor
MTNKKCVYAKLEADLRKDIMTGKFKPDIPLPGEIELSERYHISRQSTRKAIQALEKSGLVKRERGRGTFVVPAEERGTGIERKALHIMCGVAWLDVGLDEYSGKFIDGASEYAFRAGHKFSCFSSSQYDEKKLLNQYRNNEFDAIIWLSRDIKRGLNELQLFKKHQIPQLLVNRTFDDLPSIMCDNHKALTKTTSYLIETGHRAIGFINLASKHLIYQERKEAYFKVMRTAGLNPEKFYREFPCDSIAGINLEYTNSLTALITGGHSYLRPFLPWARENNICIPADLSVISINDSFEARTNPVPVSVFTESRLEIGKQAIHTIEAILRGQIHPGEKIMVNGDLIIRDSCRIIR